MIQQTVAGAVFMLPIRNAILNLILLRHHMLHRRSNMRQKLQKGHRAPFALSGLWRRKVDGERGAVFKSYLYESTAPHTTYSLSSDIIAQALYVRRAQINTGHASSLAPFNLSEEISWEFHRAVVCFTVYKVSERRNIIYGSELPRWSFALWEKNALSTQSMW
jgi:hypothetical protein